MLWKTDGVTRARTVAVIGLARWNARVARFTPHRRAENRCPVTEIVRLGTTDGCS
jgi:hypothetical protein